ncbi:hypothetical protein FQA39_LY10625 [Lamprigera yunnana]|nr:hypothetical protein FQA39_LY10625 [Lamprigera yunnana]
MHKLHQRVFTGINRKPNITDVSSCASTNSQTQKKMKFILVLSFFVAVTVAEPPVRRVAARNQVPQYVQAQFLPLPISAARLSSSRQYPVEATSPQPEEVTINDSQEVDDNRESKSKEPSQSKDDRKENLENFDKQIEEGVYYLYLPSGALQKVTYSTSNNFEKMALNAQLQLQNVDPVSGPIYTYNPGSFAFQQIIY